MSWRLIKLGYELTSASVSVLDLAGGVSVLSSKNFLAVSATSPCGRS